MADKPGLAVEMTLRGRDDAALHHNGSARPRSLEIRKGRGFPHSHSDGDCGCQIGTNCETSANRPFLQIVVQNHFFYEVITKVTLLFLAFRRDSIPLMKKPPSRNRDKKAEA
jgi:hypothetical protein